MNSKVILFSFLSILVGFSACNDSDDEEITDTVDKIKTLSTYENDQLRNRMSFEYDLEGRLVSKTFSNSDYASYTYLPDSVIEKHFVSQWQQTIEDTILLNDKGLAISEDLGNDNMEYDVEGYLIRKNTSSVEKYTFLYEIENGNTVVVSMIANNDYQTLRVMKTSKFMPNTTNTTGNENQGLSFWGKQDKELISNAEYSQGSPLNYEYEYDDKKRVSKCKVSNGISNVFTYY